MFQDIDGPEAKAVLLLGKVSQVKGLNFGRAQHMILQFKIFALFFYFWKLEK